MSPASGSENVHANRCVTARSIVALLAGEVSIGALGATFSRPDATPVMMVVPNPDVREVHVMPSGEVVSLAK